MDIIRLYQDFNIDFVTEGHKHARPGWVNCECPFCSSSMTNPGYHLGWNETDEYFFCWRCGWHPPVRTISELLKIPVNAVPEVLKQYGVNHIRQRIKPVVPKKEFKFPFATSDLEKVHKKYLINRGFNPQEIETIWRIKAVGPIGKLDGINYRFRIIIPYYWNGLIVSFDSRDITGKSTVKYIACPKEREIIEHKSILYGLQEEWTDTGICVEGPTDVWRLGVNSFAVSGIEYTHAQVRVMAQTFRRIAVIFDDEPQAQRQARKLVADLKFRGVNAWNVKITGDPGSMKQSEADELVKSIMK